MAEGCSMAGMIPLAQRACSTAGTTMPVKDHHEKNGALFPIRVGQALTASPRDAKPWNPSSFILSTATANTREIAAPAPAPAHTHLLY
jgi:hypothetical protein